MVGRGRGIGTREALAEACLTETVVFGFAAGLLASASLLCAGFAAGGFVAACVVVGGLTVAGFAAAVAGLAVAGFAAVVVGLDGAGFSGLLDVVFAASGFAVWADAATTSSGAASKSAATLEVAR